MRSLRKGHLVQKTSGLGLCAEQVGYLRQRSLLQVPSELCEEAVTPTGISETHQQPSFLLAFFFFFGMDVMGAFGDTVAYTSFFIWRMHQIALLGLVLKDTFLVC